MQKIKDSDFLAIFIILIISMLGLLIDSKHLLEYTSGVAFFNCVFMFFSSKHISLMKIIISALSALVIFMGLGSKSYYYEKLDLKEERYSNMELIHDSSYKVIYTNLPSTHKDSSYILNIKSNNNFLENTSSIDTTGTYIKRLNADTIIETTHRNGSKSNKYIANRGSIKESEYIIYNEYVYSGLSRYDIYVIFSLMISLIIYNFLEYKVRYDFSVNSNLATYVFFSFYGISTYISIRYNLDIYEYGIIMLIVIPLLIIMATSRFNLSILVSILISGLICIFWNTTIGIVIVGILLLIWIKIIYPKKQKK